MAFQPLHTTNASFVIFTLVLLSDLVRSNTVCVESPRQHDSDECAVTGGDKTCVIFFVIYLVFAVILVFALIAVHYVKQRIEKIDENRLHR